MLDWHQTHHITSVCNEENPILGACGERLAVDTYFPLVIFAHLAVGLALPRTYRELWFATIAGAEAATTWSNFLRR